MGSYRTKEDDVYKISTSVFIMNFPESCSAKELYQSCKQYGRVMDTFIPNKRSKTRRRFGFVRFINVFNEERLVNNLCTVCIDRFKLHANIARFHRTPLNEKKSMPKKAGGVKKDTGVNEVGNSYVHVVKGQMQPGNKESEVTHASVLSDECLLSKDLSKSLFERVKQFASLANMRKVEALLGWRLKVSRLSCGRIIHSSLSRLSRGSYWISMIRMRCVFTRRDYAFTRNQKRIFLRNLKLSFAAFWIRAKEAPGWVPDFMEENDNEEHNDDGGFNVRESGSCGGDSDVEGVLETIFKESGQKENNLDEEHTDKQENHSWINSEFDERTGEGRASHGIQDRWVDSVGNSRGILCVWDPNFFRKSNATDSDYFIMIRGVWRQTGNDLLIIAVYAPHDLKDKHMLWDYLTYEIGDNVFNSFITNAGLEEVPLGGSSFTWYRKSATKMSKLDRFLMSKNLLNACSNITTITLKRYLSDHRLILLRESHFDYGPTPFRFFHHWIEMEGFSKVVEDAWREGPCDKSNAMINMMIKLKYLKTRIREWNKKNMLSVKNVKAKYKDELEALEAIIDKGDGNVDVVNKRMEVVNTLQKIDKICSLEMAQKAKVKWSIEGDENTSFFHGMLNKKWSLLNIQGIMVDGMWIESPNRVKGVILVELESDVSNEEIKIAVWDYEIDKSPGPDGFTFGFYRRFWNLIENDVYDAVKYFFTYGVIPKGCNSSFIALIPKIPDANTVHDFRPISLIGSLYKVVAKILANRLVGVLGDIVNEVQSAFIAGR
nr:RNA-directed DNA polymerase, eukaryota, reverse transcriptase zinc-binding domain protein [Tanacetum cinerariifolium]